MDFFTRIELHDAGPDSVRIRGWGSLNAQTRKLCDINTDFVLFVNDEPWLEISIMDGKTWYMGFGGDTFGPCYDRPMSAAQIRADLFN